jgi:hypothetical protein
MAENVIWPFKPETDFIETLEWKTDVLRARSAEQRIALRAAPRRNYSLEHFFRSKAYSNARILMRQAASFLVPDWTLGNDVVNVTLGMGVAIAFPTAELGLAVGDQMIVWQSALVYQQIEVQSFDANGIVAVQVQTEMDRASIYPLVPALCQNGLSLRRMSNDLATGGVEMEVTANADLSASSYAQYRGHDIMPDRPLSNRGALNEAVIWPNEYIDNQLGGPAMLRERSYPDDKFTLSWEIDERTSRIAFKKWLYSRKGKQKVFWASSWAEDLDLAADIGAADTAITIFTPPGVTDLGMTAFDIDIATTAGVHYYVQITNVAEGLPVGGLDTLSLSLAAALGAALSVAEVARISFLRCARFDSDRVEIRHQGGEVCSITIPCIEVPVP